MRNKSIAVSYAVAPVVFCCLVSGFITCSLKIKTCIEIENIGQDIGQIIGRVAITSR
jgi:hypothetical protein